VARLPTLHNEPALQSAGKTKLIRPGVAQYVGLLSCFVAPALANTRATNMTDRARVILSGFGDEASPHKTAAEQFAAFAALGLDYYSIRFIDAGEGVKNVMQLTKAEIRHIAHLEDAFDVNVATIGSPIGKVKLQDVEDGTKNEYIPFKKYLASNVAKACEIAHAFETKLIRGFSFYPPKSADPHEHLTQAVEQLGQIAEACHRSDLTFGLEVEANLVGQNGHLLAEIYRQVNHPAMLLIFDAANILCQGYTPAEVFEQYQAMKPGLGWMHIKDYKLPTGAERAALNKPAKSTKTAKQAGRHINEAVLRDFVPADVGDCGHAAILRDFAELVPQLEKKLKRRGIPGVFLDLEPHLKQGGQFGGYSGPDGMGVALRGLCRVLDFVGLDYHLASFDDIRTERGS
jgi:sugar phosphate isomerase/epimerase